MTKSITPTENSKSKFTTQKRQQNFDYKTIADRLMTVSLPNYYSASEVHHRIFGFAKFLEGGGHVTSVLSPGSYGHGKSQP